MNAKLPLRSPLLYDRLSSLYAGLFVVKLNETHTRTRTCHVFYWPLTLVTRQEREVLNKRAKECVWQVQQGFFSVIWNMCTVPSPSDCSGRMGGALEPTRTSCTETTHMHLVPALFPTETFGSVETSRKQTYAFAKNYASDKGTIPLLAVEGHLDVAMSTNNSSNQISWLK